MTKTVTAYAHHNPIRTGLFAVLATLGIGISVAFAFGFVTPSQVFAQVFDVPMIDPIMVPDPVLPPCCDIPVDIIPELPILPIDLPMTPPVIITDTPATADPDLPPCCDTPAEITPEAPVEPVVVVPDPVLPPCCDTPAEITPEPPVETVIVPDPVLPPCCDTPPEITPEPPVAPVIVPDPVLPPCCDTPPTMIPDLPVVPVIEVPIVDVPDVVPPVVVPPVIPPPICDLTANPITLPFGGGSTLLSWTSALATAAAIDNGIGNVFPVDSGFELVTVLTDTMFTMTVTGPGGVASCSATVTVLPPPVQNAPICTTFAVTPANVIVGTTRDVTISWQTANATSISISHAITNSAVTLAQIGSVTPVSGGSRTVSLSPTAVGSITFTATVTGPGAPVTCSGTVTFTPPQAPAPICVSFAARDTTLPVGGGSTVLSWVTQNAVSGSIDQGVGAATPIAGGSVSVSATANTTYTLTLTGAGGETTSCTAAVTVPPSSIAPVCTLTANPSRVAPGGTTELTWTTQNVVTFVIDQNIGTVTPVAGGTVRSQAINADTLFTGTGTSVSGQTVTCTAPVTIETGGCTSNCGGCTSNCGGCTSNCGGGGGGNPGPRVSLSALPHVGEQPLAYLYLSQIPYTGLDLGTLGTILYWAALVGWAIALAYLVLFGAVPLVNRKMQGFSARVNEALQAVPAPAYGGASSAHMPAVMPPPVYAPVVHAVASAHQMQDAPEPARGHSAYEGFKSFAQNGALSIDDIVKGLSRSHAAPVAPAHIPEPARQVEPIYEKVEPIYDHVEPIVPQRSLEVPAQSRGFAIALIEGDRNAVFAGLRQHVRGAGSPEALVSSVACLLDDVYRARIDGTPCDAELARLTARLDTMTLEKLVASLTTAIDSSYAAGVTGAKLALTRALAVLGA